LVSNLAKTLICVALAGLLFITGVVHGVKPLFIPAAFLDWLPLPTGWMRFRVRDEKVRRAGALHGAVTVVAYAVGVMWLVMTRLGPVDLGYVFLELWFTAVIAGAYVTGLAAEKCM